MHIYFTFVFVLLISASFFPNISTSDPPRPNSNFNPIKGFSRIYSSVFGPQRPTEWKVSPDNSAVNLDDRSSPQANPIIGSAKSRASSQTSPPTYRYRFFSISDNSSKKVVIGDSEYLSGINEESSLCECVDILSLKNSLEKAAFERDNLHVIYLFNNFSELRTIESEVLYRAIDSGDINTLRTVLEYRGDVDFKEFILKPLRYAIEKHKSELIDSLLPYSGIERDDSLQYDEKFVSKLTRKATFAIMHRSHQSFTLLLEKIKSLGEIRAVTLQSLIFNAIQSADVFALESVLQATNNHNLVDFVNNNGINPLHSASICDFSEGLKLLINHFGVESLNHKASNDKTSCFLALESGSFACLDVILEQNPQSCLIPNQFGEDPLTFAKNFHDDVYQKMKNKIKIPQSHHHHIQSQHHHHQHHKQKNRHHHHQHQHH